MAEQTLAGNIECARDGCDNIFRPKNAQHGFCSPKCRRAARGSGWRFVREAALIRDEDTCQDCAATECSLEVHHLVALCRGGDNKLTNLVSLCRECHRARHRSWKIVEAIKGAEDQVKGLVDALRADKSRGYAHAA